MGQEQRGQQRWETVEIVQAGSLAIEVSKLPVGRPKYSICVGSRVGEDFKRFIPIFTTGQGKIEIDRERTGDLKAILATLIDALEETVLKDAQAAEDAFIDRKQHHEKKGEYRPKKKGYSGPRQKGDQRAGEHARDR
jgi:hypothetical protein